MSKGSDTRERILDRAFVLAARDGLQGLTIGALAEELQLSKSGLFAHFGSKEDLQIQVLKEGAQRFELEVVRPALKTPRGLPRLKKLMESWLDWSANPSMPGGCLFIAASTELDDREGRARDYLVATQKQLLSFLAGAARLCVEQGHFKKDLDCDLFAYEAYGVVLVFNHAKKLLRDPSADRMAHKAFERLIRSALLSTPS
jgi:AcrR family transcriptional regulator